MHQYFLANKNIIIASLIGMSLVGFSYFSSRDFSSQVIFKNAAEKINSESITLGQLVGKDTDGDGISDWEEVLWGTDPAQKASNLDGTPDNVYVEKRRALAEEKDPKTTGPAGDKINETDVLARQIFAAVSSLQNSGNLNADVVQNLSKSLAETAVQENIEVHYAPKDMRMVPVNKDTIVAYGEGLGELITKYQKSDLGDELVVIAQALKDDSASGLEKLDDYILLYQNAARDLISIATPNDIAPTYLSIINNYYNISVTLQKMKLIFENPIVGFSGLTQYSKEEQSLLENTNSLGAYFTKNAILFNK